MKSKPIWILLSIPLLGWSASLAEAAAPTAQQLEFFENKIRPVLVNQCYECHSAKSAKLRASLLVDTRDGLLQGGDNGPAIVPGKPKESLLLQSLYHTDKLKMPPKTPLSPAVIADFEKWIAMGAPDPRGGSSAAYKRLTLEDAQTFWSFIPVKNPKAPAVKNSSWPQTDADKFILAKIEEKGLKPVADASREALIRRLSFDLIGLPPTPEELDAFLKDTDSRAVEKVVDRLLASPHFGERWGRYWLDLARYGESNGNADNTPFPEAWRFRDYVIQSVNEDKPYDRFIQEQVAGDLMQPKPGQNRDHLLIATGFLALTSKPRAQNNPDYKYDLIADQIDVTTRSVMGLSVLCARCHDHKFDPIATKEYYSLAGIFDSSVMLFGAGGPRANMRATGVTGMHDLSDGGKAMGVREGSAKDCQVCIGGESTKLGETVPRGFLKVATAGTAPTIKSGSGRLELAQWLTDPANPLTARVAVNRVWLHLFGKGIVQSPDNFGLLGEKPSHPELLDHLASRFMAEGWSLKKIIRYVVLSRTYQLSTAHDEVAYKADPDNILNWRMSQRRLDAEAFRDATLMISGQLDLNPPKGTRVSVGPQVVRRPTPQANDARIRSIYLGIVRGAPLAESLSMFDAANPNIVVAQREETTVPAQALFLMNSPFILGQARATAQRLLSLPAGDDGARIDHAYRLFYSRSATSQEKDRALNYLNAATEDFSGKRTEAWASFCQVLIASGEFRYIR